MANGNGETVGLKIPDSWSNVIKTNGMWAVIILVLLGAVLGFYDTPLMTKLEAHIKESEASRRISVQTAWYNQRVLEQICIRLSTTDKQRSDCLPFIGVSQNENDTRSHR